MIVIVLVSLVSAGFIYMVHYRDDSDNTAISTNNEADDQVAEPDDSESNKKDKASSEKDYASSVELLDRTSTKLSFSYADDWRIKENNGKSIVFDTDTVAEVYVSYALNGTAPGMITSEEVRVGSNNYKKFEWSPKSGITTIRYFPQKNPNSNIEGRVDEVQFINIDAPDNIVETIDRKTQIILSTLSF